MTQLRLASPAVLVLLSGLSACQGRQGLAADRRWGAGSRESVYSREPSRCTCFIDGPARQDLAADCRSPPSTRPWPARSRCPASDTADARRRPAPSTSARRAIACTWKVAPTWEAVAMGAIGPEVRFQVWSSCGDLATGPISASIDHPFILISTNTCATAVNPSSTAPCTVGLRLTPPTGAAPTVEGFISLHAVCKARTDARTDESLAPGEAIPTASLQKADPNVLEPSRTRRPCGAVKGSRPRARPMRHSRPGSARFAQRQRSPRRTACARPRHRRHGL